MVAECFVICLTQLFVLNKIKRTRRKEMKKDFNKSKKDFYKKIWFISIIILNVIGIIFWALFAKEKAGEVEEISYNQFVQMVESEKVKEVQIDIGGAKLELEDVEGKTYTSDNPRTVDFKKFLLENEVSVVEVKTREINFLSLTLTIIQLILLSCFLFVTMGKGKEVGSEYSKDEKNKKKVTFDDIAGHEEVKEEMKELISFLKDPKKYKEMGAKMPKGVLLVGPPGTGKTLIAKAMAGEAGVPFYSASGSDFVEMYVGVGARNVRKLFAKARKNPASVIFIDEIDAVAKKRGGRDSHSENEQTVNALLTEMDGFKENDNIIVIVATNRVDVLDDAFVRPGRFDKRITVNLPDKQDRISIIKRYMVNKKVSEDVSIEEIAQQTIGFSGAGIEALINESAIVAVSKGHKCINAEDIDDAYYKCVMNGNKKKNKERTHAENELIAWHEAGHALCTMLLTDDEMAKVTIIPSTSGAGGVSISTPKKMGLLTKGELENKIKVAYAGRVAESLLRGSKEEVTTGASNDIEQATKMIDAYISVYGMTEEIGLLNLKDSESSQVNDMVLKEKIAISKRLYNETVEFLTQNKKMIVEIANKLLEQETLTGTELKQLIGQEPN